jgi:hypothetical protein
MNRESDIAEVLQRLAESLPREASPQTKARVIAAYRARNARSRRPWTYWAGAVACLAISAAGFLAHDTCERSQGTIGVSDAYSPATAGFVALPYGQSDVPLEQVVIVSVNLRPSELDALGVSVRPGKSTEKIHAELLVGQDGIARAVRVLDAR